jgi:hypothetical protein
MDERGRVVEMERPGCEDTLGAEDGVREFVAELFVGAGGEEIGRGVDIDHGHAIAPGWD